MSMPRHCRAVARRAATPVLFIFLVACGSRLKMPSKLSEALISEQNTNRIVLGHKDGEWLEYFDADARFGFGRSFTPFQLRDIRSIDLRGANGVLESPDKKWIATCTDKMTCTINEKGDP